MELGTEVRIPVSVLRSKLPKGTANMSRWLEERRRPARQVDQPSNAEIIKAAHNTPLRNMPDLPFHILTDERFLNRLSLACFMTFAQHCDRTPSSALSAMSRFLNEKAKHDPVIRKFMQDSLEMEDPWRFDWYYGYRP
jgi:hypothetical protein